MKRADKKALEAYKKRLEFARSSGGVNPDETKEEKKARIQRAKKDPAFMIRYYFSHYADAPTPDFHVEFMNMVKRKKTFKGFAEWGRALAKSVVCDIFLPFWLWMNGELNYLVLVSVNKDRAAELLDDLQAELEGNPRIIHDFGEQYNLGEWESGDFKTKGGLRCKALGAKQSVRGLRKGKHRPDMCIIDDLETEETIENEKRQKKIVRWVERSLIPTMDGKRRRFIQANNRFAPVMIQTMLQKSHPKWKVHHIKAYNPVTYEPTWKGKYTNTYFKEIEDEIGSLSALAEYNHEAHIEGEIFTDDLIQWTKIPRLDHFKLIVGHWDVAYAGTPTSDYNAVRIWGLKGRDFYYITSFVKRCKMKQAVAFMCDFDNSLPSNAVVLWQYEAQFWNDEVQRTIEDTSMEINPNFSIAQVERSTVKKYNRIVKTHVYYQNNRVWYNEKMKSHNDTQTGLVQLKAIEPNYKSNDDAPDADEACFSVLSKSISSSTGKARSRTGKIKHKHQW